MAESRGAADSRLKVFVSYSRQDLSFTERLVEALEARGLDVLIDRRDLPLAVEFQKELLGFIRQADTVVYVVSEASITSRWCEWEVQQVDELHKRLAPVVVQAVEDARIPDSIRKINFVFFTGEHAQGRGFEAQADALAAALKTDVGWLKEHTRLASWRGAGSNAARLRTPCCAGLSLRRPLAGTSVAPVRPHPPPNSNSNSWRQAGLHRQRV